MSARLGLELGPELVRAVRLERWGRRVQVFEQHWDPDAPTEMASALLESLGPAGRVAVAVDLTFLFAKHVRLPPLSAAEKRRILALEPERFFPVRSEELIVAARGEDNLVFAARAASLESWLRALEAVGPVELVEPSPVSLGRALGRVAPGEAVVLIEEKHRGIGIAEIGGGRLRSIRRLGDTAELANLVAEPAKTARPIYLRPLNGKAEWSPPEAAGAKHLPSVAGIAPSHLAAYGAALGMGAAPDEALLPAELDQRIRRRRRRSLLLGSMACVLGLVFALLSLNDYRARALQTLEAETARIRQPAERVLTLQRQADQLALEARAVADIEAQRVDPQAALATLTRQLPPEAYLTALRGAGRDWQIDGYAREAAPLLGRLEGDFLFDSVRFLSATSRTRMNGKLYESFSIALRLVPAP